MPNATSEKAADHRPEPVEPRFTARAASVDDVRDFIIIARIYAAERYPLVPFDPQQALHTFAGIGRADPYVFLLFEGEQVIGLATLYFRPLPFSNELQVYQDVGFVAAAHAGEEAEAALLAAVHATVLNIRPREAQLKIDAPSPHSKLLYDRLEASGYVAKGLLVSTSGALDQPKRDVPPTDAAETIVCAFARAALH